MSKRYRASLDQFALKVQNAVCDRTRPPGLLVFGRPYDRLCDVAEVLGRHGAIGIEILEKESIAKAISRTPELAGTVLKAGVALPLHATEMQRLSLYLKEMACEALVIEAGEKLLPRQIRILNQSLARLVQTKTWTKKIVVITTGTPAEFEPLFQAHKVGWSTLVCPRLDAEDVKEIFSMNGIEVGDDDTVTSLLLNFSRFGPHGLFTLAEVAAKRQLGVLSVEKARLLADDIDSDAELRRKPPKLTFMSIRSAKPRPRRNAPGQLKMNLGHED